MRFLQQSPSTPAQPSPQASDDALTLAREALVSSFETSQIQKDSTRKDRQLLDRLTRIWGSDELNEATKYTLTQEHVIKAQWAYGRHQIVDLVKRFIDYHDSSPYCLDDLFKCESLFSFLFEIKEHPVSCGAAASVADTESVFDDDDYRGDADDHTQSQIENINEFLDAIAFKKRFNDRVIVIPDPIANLVIQSLGKINLDKSRGQKKGVMEAIGNVIQSSQMDFFLKMYRALSDKITLSSSEKTSLLCKCTNHDDFNIVVRTILNKDESLYDIMTDESLPKLLSMPTRDDIIDDYLNNPSWWIETGFIKYMLAVRCTHLEVSKAIMIQVDKNPSIINQENSEPCVIFRMMLATSDKGLFPVALKILQEIPFSSNDEHELAYGLSLLCSDMPSSAEYASVKVNTIEDFLSLVPEETKKLIDNSDVIQWFLGEELKRKTGSNPYKKAFNYANLKPEEKLKETSISGTDFLSDPVRSMSKLRKRKWRSIETITGDDFLRNFISLDRTQFYFLYNTIKPEWFVGDYSGPEKSKVANLFNQIKQNSCGIVIPESIPANLMIPVLIKSMFCSPWWKEFSTDDLYEFQNELSWFSLSLSADNAGSKMIGIGRPNGAFYENITCNYSNAVSISWTTAIGMKDNIKAIEMGLQEYCQKHPEFLLSLSDSAVSADEIAVSFSSR